MKNEGNFKDSSLFILHFLISRFFIHHPQKYIMKNFKSLFIGILFCIACFPLTANAQNPYLPLWEFIPDGEPYVFEDPDNPGKYRVYIYGSHDMLEDKYCGRDQVVWSAPVDDLKHWRYDGVIFESKYDANGKLLNKDGVGDVLYAPDVAEVKTASGKKVYYLYPNVQADGRKNLVAKADRPDGPFKVCNWNPENPRETVGPFDFDPAAFVDDDGRAYGYWGFETSWAAELDPTTMATVKSGTQEMRNLPGYKEDNNFRFFEASSIRKIKDKYVFVYSRWTNEGEFGLPQNNYTLAYCYSNSPLGPWTYGGTIIDGRGRETRPDGTTVATACPGGNTHGSICEINGKWYVFYHRQAGTSEYSRQAMVAPIQVEVKEGPTGYVRISEAEFTSEGFATEGLDPYEWTQGGIACYFVGPKPAYQEYPNVVYPGSHTKIIRGLHYDAKDPYAVDINLCPLVNNTDGSVAGYKYFNFSKTFGKAKLTMAVDYEAEGIDGTIDIYLDRPSIAEGGVKIGTMKISAKDGRRTVKVPVSQLRYYNGKHALFLVFSSPVKGKSICQINGFNITK